MRPVTHQFRRIAVLTGLTAAFVVAVPLYATAFIGGTVTSTTLNIRLPGKPSGILKGAYVSGEDISLTGPCRRWNSSYTTAISNFNMFTLKASGQTTAQIQTKIALSRTWCQVWHDKTTPGTFAAGWVNASFVALQ
jgi:hypothetical protein